MGRLTEQLGPCFGGWSAQARAKNQVAHLPARFQRDQAPDGYLDTGARLVPAHQLADLSGPVVTYKIAPDPVERPGMMTRDDLRRLTEKMPPAEFRKRLADTRIRDLAVEIGEAEGALVSYAVHLGLFTNVAPGRRKRGGWTRRQLEAREQDA